MTGVLNLLPLLAVLGCLVCGGGPVRAGLFGSALTLVLATVALGGVDVAAPIIAVAVARALWMAWPAVAVIGAGLFFHHAVCGGSPVPTGPTGGVGPAAPGPTAPSHRGLFAACFLFGSFAESATGFGVGGIMAAAAALRLGVTGAPAAICALFSQILAPWGALAVGTVVGAGVAGIPAADLGVGTAVLTVPLLLLDLLLFWSVCRRMGRVVPWRDRLDDAGWLAGLAGALYLSNRLMPVEVAGLAATATVSGLRIARDRMMAGRTGGGDDRAGGGARQWPLVALTVVLLATRLMPGVPEALKGLMTLRPVDGWPTFFPFHHVSAWLVVVAVTAVMMRAGTPPWRGLVATAARTARVPVVVTVLFMVMAQWMTASGMTGALASDWRAAAGTLAPMVGPVFGGIAGFLTGSSVASNSLMMPLQVALTSVVGADPYWMAAAQNTVGAALTMLSPMRVAMVCAVVAGSGVGSGAGSGMPQEWTARAVYVRLGLRAIAAPAMLAGVAMALAGAY